MFNTFFDTLWNTALYRPVFNALIYIYQTIAGGNMGWAVVWLTIFLRVVLLPLNVVSERNSIKREQANTAVEKALAAYKGDKIAQKEATRKIIRQYKISPWAKAVMLAIQVVMFVLLYQVFIHGISGERMFKTLYPGMEIPGVINADFYGFDIGARHDSVWAGICAIYLLIAIYLESRNLPKGEKPDLLYLVGFPLIMFAALWYLPMVKSLFILTSMIFSDIITIVRKLLFSSKPKAASAAHH